MVMDQVHNKFLHDLREGSKLFPDNQYSMVPTVVFLVTAFALIYRQFHKNTHNLTSLKSKLCKDLIFQWTYFYTARIWFMFLKACRWVVHFSESSLSKNASADEIHYNQLITRSCMLVLVLTTALIPCIVFYLQNIYQRDIPNFLLWVGEDPWVRSEIGTSGHYLQRPPRADIYSPHKHNLSYRSGRSSSVDTNINIMQKTAIFLRPCKSDLRVKKSSEDIPN